MSLSNFRVIYPVHYVAIGGYGQASGVPIHGLQSVSLTTTFNLEQVFELGQLNIYANLENLPNIEMTLEKCLDGYPLIYHLSSKGSTAPDLLNRTNQRADVFLSVFSDGQVASSGTPMLQAYCSGMYVNSLAYSIPLQGAAKETVTLVGNDKIWITGSGTTWLGGTGFAFNGAFTTNADAPASGIQRRFNVNLGPASGGGSVFPRQIPGITTVTGSGYNLDQGNGLGYGAHLQDVSISANLAREDLYELGRRRPYYRYAKFPVAIDCSINITAGGTQPGDTINANSDKDNIIDEPILISLQDGTTFNLGINNKLLSIGYSGGDVSGEPVRMTYSYQNFNYLVIQSPADPMHL